MSDCVPVVGFENEYKIDASGRVYSSERTVLRSMKDGSSRTRTIFPRELRSTPASSGHRYVDLSKGGKVRRFYVHRLVLEAFVGPCPEGEECRHLNGDPSDNRLENLAWGTRSENLLDRNDHGVKLNQHHGKAECIRGHKFTPENTYVSQGYRSCKTCKREAKLSV